MLLPNNPKSRHWLRWLLAVPVVLVLALAFFVVAHSGLGVSDTNPPKFIQADFIDLSRIYGISKFRSLAGHDFSGNGETCRSMKHYFEPQQTNASSAYMNQHHGIPEPPNGRDDIPVYRPVDGTVVGIGTEHTPIGSQIFIVPDHAGAFTIRLFHVWPIAGPHGGIPLFGWGGSHVKAGQKVGVIGAHQGTDISVQVGNMPWNEDFISYFDVMPDSIFVKYQTRGLTARSDVVLTKAYRDAHAVTCQKGGEEKFNLPAGYN